MKKKLTDWQKEWVKDFKKHIGIDPIMDLYLTGNESFEKVAEMNAQLIMNFCEYLSETEEDER